MGIKSLQNFSIGPQKYVQLPFQTVKIKLARSTIDILGGESGQM